MFRCDCLWEASSRFWGSIQKFNNRSSAICRICSSSAVVVFPGVVMCLSVAPVILRWDFSWLLSCYRRPFPVLAACLPYSFVAVGALQCSFPVPLPVPLGPRDEQLALQRPESALKFGIVPPQGMVSSILHLLLSPLLGVRNSHPSRVISCVSHLLSSSLLGVLSTDRVCIHVPNPFRNLKLRNSPPSRAFSSVSQLLFSSLLRVLSTGCACLHIPSPL
ncbi:uncharacterized protein LOC123037602 [Drosophila rhopaloa]|uniref:Transmembrane protein n=1 Tax=Drosophila rhopaloa TaxID=1041015 RepID=A0ABM5J8L9_DRORH|nr:uncharacterized protein LOC123037602 [Drosophila rhopaloa]